MNSDNIPSDELRASGSSDFKLRLHDAEPQRSTTSTTPRAAGAAAAEVGQSLTLVKDLQKSVSVPSRHRPEVRLTQRSPEQDREWTSNEKKAVSESVSESQSDDRWFDQETSAVAFWGHALPVCPEWATNNRHFPFTDKWEKNNNKKNPIKNKGSIIAYWKNNLFLLTLVLFVLIIYIFQIYLQLQACFGTQKEFGQL